MFGAELSAMRSGRHLSLRALASRINYNYSYLSKIENGNRAPSPDIATALDRFFNTGQFFQNLQQGEEQGFSSPNRSKNSGTRTNGQHLASKEDDMRRREFITGAMAFSLVGLLPRRILQVGDEISETDVQDGWSALRRLYELDDSLGGAKVYELAAAMSNRLDAALQHGKFTPSIAPDLQLLTATAMEHSGWLAFDSGSEPDARRWWLEASHLADVSGIPDARVVALLSMALQASTSLKRGKETVSLVTMARRLADRNMSPVLQSLLAAREGVGHALLGDGVSARSLLASARELLKLGRNGAEPVWLDFWSSADLACHETRAAVALDDRGWAVESARYAYSTADKQVFPRNFAIYSTRLASVLTRYGDTEEAAVILEQAVGTLENVRGSKRSIDEFVTTVASLAETGNSAAAKISKTANITLSLGN